MTEWIEQDKKDENHLYVHLKDPSLLDLSIFDRMSNDDFCLPCMLTNEKVHPLFMRLKAIFLYMIF